MRAKEFITEKKQLQQVDEFLPVLGAAAGALGRAALTGGAALGRGAMAAGSALAKGAGQVASGIGKAATTAGNVASKAATAVGNVANKAGQVGSQIAGQMGAGQTQTPQQIQAELPKPGSLFNHPQFGPIKVLSPVSGQKGLKLDTTKQLGYPIIIDPQDLVQK